MNIGFLTNAIVEQSRRMGSDAFVRLEQVADWEEHWDSWPRMRRQGGKTVSQRCSLLRPWWQ